MFPATLIFVVLMSYEISRFKSTKLLFNKFSSYLFNDKSKLTVLVGVVNKLYIPLTKLKAGAKLT